MAATAVAVVSSGQSARPSYSDHTTPTTCGFSSSIANSSVIQSALQCSRRRVISDSDVPWIPSAVHHVGKAQKYLPLQRCRRGSDMRDVWVQGAGGDGLQGEGIRRQLLRRLRRSSLPDYFSR